MTVDSQTSSSQPHRIYYLVVALAMLLLCPCVSPAFAQIAGTGSIQGRVVDPTGAVLPDASVTIIENATQVKHTVRSDASGLYNFPNIPVGTYTLNATAQG